MLIATSSFWTVPANVQPVRASLGAPPGFATIPACWPAAPTRHLLHAWDPDHYLALLDERTDALLARVEALAVSHERVAFCCWEKDPATCHRSLLASWLRGHGYRVEVR